MPNEFRYSIQGEPKPEPITEPVVGNPEQMAHAIARGLDICQQFRDLARVERDDTTLAACAEDLFRELEWALEHYNED